MASCTAVFSHLFWDHHTCLRYDFLLCANLQCGVGWAPKSLLELHGMFSNTALLPCPPCRRQGSCGRQGRHGPSSQQDASRVQDPSCGHQAAAWPACCVAGGECWALSVSPGCFSFGRIESDRNIRFHVGVVPHCVCSALRQSMFLLDSTCTDRLNMSLADLSAVRTI